MYGVVLLAAITAGSESADFGRRGRSCCGCSGAVAYSCGGCYGGRVSYGCGGCYGGRVSYGCGGYAGCYGGGYSGCGVVYSAPVYAAPVYSGCGGAPVYHGCCGGAVVVPGRKTAYAAPANAGVVVVSLPAEAQLTIDGAATVSTSSERSFQTPELEQGKAYTYTLVAKYEQAGKPVTVSKKVKVEAGKVSDVDLNEAAPATPVSVASAN